MRIVLFTLFLFGLLTASASAQDFTGYYNSSNWTVSGTGSINWSIPSITLNGPDGGLPAGIDVFIVVPADGTLSFAWSYFSTDEPGFDSAYYFVNTEVFLSKTSGESGSVSVPVAAGDIMGWSVLSDDGLLGPGHLTISNFSAPVPEPSAVGLVAALGATLAIRRRTRACAASSTLEADA